MHISLVYLMVGDINLNKGIKVDDNNIEKLKESESKTTLKILNKFITSPTDIDVHRKVELQDAEVTEAQCNAFEELCNEYKDIFSTDSSDIGKTPLIEMEIDTGDSPPITQKPYALPLKHAAWYNKS